MPTHSTPLLGRVLTTVAIRWDEQTALGYFRLYQKKGGFAGWYAYVSKEYVVTPVSILQISPKVSSDLGGGTPLLSLILAGGQLIDQAKQAGTGNIGGLSPGEEKVKAAAAATDGMVDEWLRNWRDGGKNKTYKELEKRLDDFYGQGYRFAPNVMPERTNKVIWSPDWSAFTGTSVLSPGQTPTDLTITRDSTYRSPSPPPTAEPSSPRLRLGAGPGPGSPRSVSGGAGYPGIGQVIGKGKGREVVGSTRAEASGSGSGSGGKNGKKEVLVDVSGIKFGQEILEFARKDDWRAQMLMQFDEFTVGNEKKSFFLHKDYLSAQDEHTLAFLPESLLRTKTDKENEKLVGKLQKKNEELEERVEGLEEREEQLLNTVAELKKKLETSQKLVARLKEEKKKRGVVEVVKDMAGKAVEKTAEVFGGGRKPAPKRKRLASKAEVQDEDEAESEVEEDGVREEEIAEEDPRKRRKGNMGKAAGGGASERVNGPKGVSGFEGERLADGESSTAVGKSGGKGNGKGRGKKAAGAV